jgi:hypothetical protein
MKVKPPREKGTSFFKSKKFLTSLIGFFIIFIMVFSVMDLWDRSGDSYKYKGIEFNNDQNGWVGYIGSNAVQLGYNPQELENVTDVDFSGFDSVQKIYLATDDPLALYKSIDYFRKRVPLSPTKVVSCTPQGSNVSECDQLPLKDCEDADNSVGVIIFKKSDEFKTSFLSNTCMVIEGNNENMLKVFDKAMLKMLGV